MSEFSPDARAILDAARAVPGPTTADRARVQAALRAKIQLASHAAAASHAPTPSSAAAVGKTAGSVGLFGKTVVGMAVALGLALPVVRAHTHRSAASAPARDVAATRTRPVPPPDLVRENPVEPVIAPEATQGEASAEALVPSVRATAAVRAANVRRVASAIHVENNTRNALPAVTSGVPSAPAPGASPTNTPAPQTAAPSGGLAEETRLLAEARAALRWGQNTRAIALLDEHAARFPAGALREERMAVRVIALCRIGHNAEARAAAREFLREVPHSPLAPHVRAACGDIDEQTPGSPAPSR